MHRRGWVGLGILVLAAAAACGKESSDGSPESDGGEGGEPAVVEPRGGEAGLGGKPAYAGMPGAAGSTVLAGSSGSAGSGGSGGGAVAGSTTGGTTAESGGDSGEDFACDRSFTRNKLDDRTDAGGADGGIAGEDGGAGEAGAGGAGSARQLSLLIESGPWQVVQQTTGIAADAAGHVYVADSGTVYAVQGRHVSTFLTLEDVSPVVGHRGDGGFYDLDIGPDQRLYLAVGSTVMRTDTPHRAQLWRDLGQGWLPSYEKLGVLAGGCVGLLNGEGFWLATPQGQRRVYDREQVQYQQGCAAEDLATAASGVFLYQPGCNGYPLRRGHADGSGMATLYETDTLGKSPLHASNFNCVARDPAGGFYALVSADNYYHDPQLFHLTDTSDDSNGFEPIATTPSIAEANAAHGNVLTFDFCSLAAAPNGDVYIQTIGQLWRVRRARF